MMFCIMFGLVPQLHPSSLILSSLRTTVANSVGHYLSISKQCQTCLHSLETKSSQFRYVSRIPRTIQIHEKFPQRTSWTGVLQARSFTATSVHQMFWEKDHKDGYESKEKYSKKKLIREGLKELRGEIAKWQDEVKEKFECDPIFVRPGDMDKLWELKTEDDLKKWVVTSDKDHGEGFSSGGLSLSPTGHGLFAGELSTRVPKDGRVKRAGYVNMMSLRPRKSFKREMYFDWTLYNTLELRARGDGRSYLINISTAGYFDITWHDMYTYVLYTRGGPHWQVSRIPFSKFFLNSKGRIQDKQSPIPLDRVVSVGIAAGDRINAPFRLEIDYLGVYCDPDHTEEFAYEMYQLPKFYIH